LISIKIQDFNNVLSEYLMAAIDQAGRKDYCNLSPNRLIMRSDEHNVREKRHSHQHKTSMA